MIVGNVLFFFLFSKLKNIVRNVYKFCENEFSSRRWKSKIVYEFLESGRSSPCCDLDWVKMFFRMGRNKFQRFFSFIGRICRDIVNFVFSIIFYSVRRFFQVVGFLMEFY